MNLDSKNIRYPSLQRYISQSGYCSRRKAAQLIEEGKVELAGIICRNPWQPVEPGHRVKVEGVGIQSHKPKRLLYLALHKPPGYLTTNADPAGRPCAIDLIQPIYSERLFHVGRLDKNSSGLIFFTNDGDFAQSVQHPSKAMEKEYEVKTRKGIPEFVLQHWQRGIEIEGVRYKLRHYQMIGHREVRLVLTEGLNREIRRVFEHFHIPLKRVHRLRIGTVKLRGLAAGEFRPLKGFEIKALQTGKNPELTAADEEGAVHRTNHTDRRGRKADFAQCRPRPLGNNYPGSPHGENQRGLYNTPSSPYQSKSGGHSAPRSQFKSRQYGSEVASPSQRNRRVRSSQGGFYADHDESRENGSRPASGRGQRPRRQYSPKFATGDKQYKGPQGKRKQLREPGRKSWR